MKHFLLLLIRFYQKYISPYKGYKCAYGVLHQNGSCSQKVAEIIEQNGIFNSYALVRNQFVQCNAAYEELKKEEKIKDKKRKKNVIGAIHWMPVM